jgi:hypothetical protein
MVILLDGRLSTLSGPSRLRFAYDSLDWRSFDVWSAPVACPMSKPPLPIPYVHPTTLLKSNLWEMRNLL